MINYNMRFIDLFAGLGGFHLALQQLNHTCVFACEIDKTLRDIYWKNFTIMPAGDIRELDLDDIPSHDILCAGFPCQPFSKAGSQEGLEDPELGALYRYILRILKHHQPRYFILENVPNLQRHNDGKTWSKLERLFRAAGYHVDAKRLSPHKFGIPQIRERMYIVGSIQPLNGFSWPEPTTGSRPISFRGILAKKPQNARKLSKQVRQCLAVWQEFLDRVPTKEKLPHPLWSMEFGATYPYENTTPASLSARTLRRYKGSHGQSLRKAKSLDDILSMLPSHARSRRKRFPEWKIRFIRKNREFYKRNKNWIDSWIPKIRTFSSSFQKLEWNCLDGKRQLRRYIIQLRASGVRVKRPTTAPSLVAMTATQVPIVTWESRYMTPSECKRLQSMEGLRYLPESPDKAYGALGNAINIEVAKRVAEALVGRA